MKTLSADARARIGVFAKARIIPFACCQSNVLVALNKVSVVHESAYKDFLEKKAKANVFTLELGKRTRSFSVQHFATGSVHVCFCNQY